MKKGAKIMTADVPEMMTIKECAKTGILPEYALRRMVKENKIPHVMTGNKALINFTLLCRQLNNL